MRGSRRSRISVSKSGVAPSTASAGYPRPRMPQKGPADTRCASVTSPKRWRATASGPSATTSLATTPLTSPVPYRMPKRLPFVAYVDERRASKRACARHVGAPHATDGIHRLLARACRR